MNQLTTKWKQLPVDDRQKIFDKAALGLLDLAVSISVSYAVERTYRSFMAKRRQTND